MTAITVEPLSGPIDASVSVPGSKSIANRALVCAALAGGTSELANLPDGDDVEAMLGALSSLGLPIERDDAAVSLSGWAGPPPSGERSIQCGLAGTTSRFLLGMAATSPGPITVDGLGPLRQRPFGPLVAALRALEVDVDHVDRTELPLRISGPIASDHVALPGDVSSQFISSLMMAGPVTERGLTIEIEGELVSRPYVEMTAAVMRRFGAHVDVGRDSIGVIGMAEGGGYRAAVMEIEPDASSASYPLAIAAMIGGSMRIPGLGTESLQGDARFVDLLEQMGCRVERGTHHLTVHRPLDRRLTGIDVDMADISDLVPTLAAVATMAEGATRIRGVGFIRRKESDRLGDLAGEWRKLGVTMSETDDGLLITGPTAHRTPGRVATHHDHRVAMSSALLGLTAGGVSIEDPDVVSKSWPGYWTMIDQLRAQAPHQE